MVYAQVLASVVTSRNLTVLQAAEVARNGRLLFDTITAIQNFTGKPFLLSLLLLINLS